ncbi:hypothetical protein TREES_T100021583 [Tupaia chinensis]|uniref:Uncharacterized protein n=1 Tax=Tupaia chinensis TaxID=246437 RepID=L9K502_TUPCH|nr:hypothetical protein TREES_T100021583 [Tupaia chinensis]
MTTASDERAMAAGTARVILVKGGLRNTWHQLSHCVISSDHVQRNRKREPEKRTNWSRCARSAQGVTVICFRARKDTFRRSGFPGRGPRGD